MSSTPACRVVLATTVAKQLLAETELSLAQHTEKPLLVGFLANEDPAARVYADYTAKTCHESGFRFELRERSKEDIEIAIIIANEDINVNGIIVYYPVFSGEPTKDKHLQSVVTPRKDVEGLCHSYIYNMYQNVRFLDAPRNTQKSILPCTPLAVIKVLEFLNIYNTILPYGNRLYGRIITVINRSEVVGRPLAALLANDGAVVHSVDLDGVHIFTRGAGLKSPRHEVRTNSPMTLPQALAVSDVVISGVPGHGFKVPIEHLKEGVVCINFSSEKNFDKDAVKERASIYVPATGKVTIAILLRNLLRLVDIQQSDKVCQDLYQSSMKFRNGEVFHSFLKKMHPRVESAYPPPPDEDQKHMSTEELWAQSNGSSIFPLSRYVVERDFPGVLQPGFGDIFPRMPSTPIMQHQDLFPMGFETPRTPDALSRAMGDDLAEEQEEPNPQPVLERVVGPRPRGRPRGSRNK